MQQNALILGLITLALASACMTQPDGGQANSNMTSALTEHRSQPSLATGSLKKVGEDCTAHGYAECASRLCLHAMPEPNTGYFCTRNCQGDSDCPVQWHCAQSFPGSREQVCLPPQGWVSAAADATAPKR
jgi:hypothetical protein